MKVVKSLIEIDGKASCVTVPSASRPEVKHKVVVSCSCEGFQFVGYCYHIKEAADVLKADLTVLRERTKQRCVRAHR